MRGVKNHILLGTQNVLPVCLDAAWGWKKHIEAKKDVRRHTKCEMCSGFGNQNLSRVDHAWASRDCTRNAKT